MRVIIAGSRDFEPAEAMALVAEAAGDVIKDGWTDGEFRYVDDGEPR